MKIVFIFLFCLLISANLTFSQWEHIATIGNNNLRGVKFFNEYTGIVVGEGGIWRSTNSGINWSNVLYSQNMNSLSFYDLNNGYAVGDSGKILRTFNNGLNWIQQGNSVTTYNLNSVSHSTLLRCNIAGNGGIILRTLDGGTSWSIQGTGGPNNNSIIMNFAGEGLTFGGTTTEVIRSTLNGGTNWLTILNTGQNVFFDGTFLNNSLSFIAIGSNGYIRKTINGGTNWTFPLSNTSAKLNSVITTNTNEGYIAGDNGIILKTTNSGDSWFNINTGTNSNLNDISFINTQTGWAVGANGDVLRTGILLSISINEEVNESFKFYQNYPNPFNPITNIKFEIKKEAHVVLKIFDINGSEISRLINQILEPDIYKVIWDATNYASGIYMIYFLYDNFLFTKKLIYIK